VSDNKEELRLQIELKLLSVDLTWGDWLVLSGWV
jgi:hypothetical protein